MGHYCWMCGRHRANERFSGKGHKQHLCKDCAKLPRAERARIQALEDIYSFFDQRNISARNVARLTVLCASEDEQVRALAALVLEVAKVKPHRRKRLKYLRQHRPDLIDRLVHHGLCERWVDYELLEMSQEEFDACCPFELHD